MALPIVRFNRTRLAPSPTGRLHLGHARTFLITWCMARQAGAQILLRMEDLDPGRAKEEAIAQAYEDLKWLGIDWDLGGNDERPKTKHETTGGEGSFVQSERAAAGVYAKVIEQLWQRDKVFPCTCTRADLLAAVTAGASAPHDGENQPRYPGTCRIPANAHPCIMSSGQNPAPPRIPSHDVASMMEKGKGKPVCWRFLVEPGVVRFDDAILGPQAFDVSADVGDFPLTRFDGTPAYQLAVVTDDAAMDVDCVIRGDDLLSSTPRQILIYEALGKPLPTFAHVPLVVGTDGKRLAKRHGESRIAQFRENNVPAERVIGWVAWRSGQVERPTEMNAAELRAIFDLAKLPKERVVMTSKDLEWLRSCGREPAA